MAFTVSLLAVGMGWDGATFVGSCGDDDGSTNGGESVDCCFDGKDGDSFRGATKLLVVAAVNGCFGCCLGTSVLGDAGGVFIMNT